MRCQQIITDYWKLISFISDVLFKLTLKSGTNNLLIRLMKNTAITMCWYLLFGVQSKNNRNWLEIE